MKMNFLNVTDPRKTYTGVWKKWMLGDHLVRSDGPCTIYTDWEMWEKDVTIGALHELNLISTSFMMKQLDA